MATVNVLCKIATQSWETAGKVRLDEDHPSFSLHGYETTNSTSPRLKFVFSFFSFSFFFSGVLVLVPVLDRSAPPRATRPVESYHIILITDIIKTFNLTLLLYYYIVR